MKVLIISHSYIEESNHSKLRELAVFKDVELAVLHPSSWKTWHGENKVSVKVEALSYKEFTSSAYFSPDPGKYFLNPIHFIKVLFRFRPNIIHLEEEPWTPIAFQTAVFAIFFRIKLIVFSWENLELPLNWWRKSIQKFVLMVATRIIAGNSGAKARLKRYGYSREISILPQFGIDTELFTPEKPIELQDLKKAHRLNGLVIGFIGRMVPEKGIETLVKAVSAYKEELTLLFLSSSKTIPQNLKRLIDELGLKERTRFLTGVPNSEFPKYIKLMDIVVLPSISTERWVEQFGRVLVEAMACGVPVIGSSSGAIPEVVGSTGLIFREGDANDLHAKIESIASSETQRNELIKKGFERVAKNFSNKVLSAKTHDIYRSL